MTACTACGADNRTGRKFCGRCGDALAMTCSACGTANQSDELFCGECGASLAPSAPPSPETAPVSGERKQITVLFADWGIRYRALIESGDAQAADRCLDRARMERQAIALLQGCP